MKNLIIKLDNDNSDKNFIRVIYSIIIFTILIFALVYYIFNFTVNKFKEHAETQRELSLKEKVFIAKNAINPIILDYQNKIISKDSATEITRQIIKNLVYSDEYGVNYIFMNKMDGTVLARPYRLQDELQNQINLPDYKGEGMRTVVNDVKAHPEGAFSRYMFINPANKELEEKLSFSILIPELDSHIGTGAYMSTATKSQIQLIKDSFLLANISAILIALPLILALLALKKRNDRYKLKIIEKIAITQELKKNEEDLRITLSSIGDAVIATDAQGLITRMNYQAEKLTGWNFDIAKGLHLNEVFQIINADTMAKCVSPVDKVIQSGEIVALANHTVLISKNGDEKQISDSGAPIRNDIGEIVGVVLVFRDVTEEYRLREEAKQKDLAFETIFEASPFAISISSLKDHTFKVVNSAFEKLTQINRNEAIGKNSFELGMVDAYDKIDLFAKKIKEKRFINNEIHKKNLKDGKELITLYSTRVIYYKGEECVLTITTDITEMRKLQEQLSHIQKMDAIGQLAGGIAHDFNNMLSGILGAAELLQMENMTDEKRAHYIKILLDSTNRASELTKKLLTFSRKNICESSAVDIHDVLKSSGDLLSRSLDKKINLEMKLSAENHNIIGDNSQLMNMFINLGINAGHAMPDGGELIFSTRNVELEESFCKNSTFNINPGKYILIEVQDSGAGISADILPKIFEPFFTTKENGKGTGLGLSMVYGSIVQHNGAINVYSEIGRGSVFHIYLPLNENQISENKHAKRESVRGNGRILIVDDEEIIRLTVNDILESLGYQTLTAINGREALEIFKEKKDEIDLVLMDMIMPEMNGKECFFELIKIKPDVKIVLSSGFTRENDINDLIDLGLRAFIRKPFHTAELSKVLAEALT